MARISTLLAALICSAVAHAQGVFIDKDTCPGEGCEFGETWTARTAIQLREAPDPSAAVAFIVEEGESVLTRAGEVHTIPGRFEVHRAQGEFVPGDEVFVYTYRGEGWFRIRHNGEIKVADLGFSPWGGTAGTRCADEQRCWGSLSEELQFDWWVLVETEGGEQGWARVERGLARDQWVSGQ
jgi:hypothetical protein